MRGWSTDEPDPEPLREILEEVLAEHRRRSGADGEAGRAVPINLYQDGAWVVVEAALPGVPERAIDLSCTEGTLTIRARLEVAERDYLHQELASTDFERQIALPGDCRFEEAEASLEAGMLQIRIPKDPPRDAPRIRIEVTRRRAPIRSIDAGRGGGERD